MGEFLDEAERQTFKMETQQPKRKVFSREVSPRCLWLVVGVLLFTCILLIISLVTVISNKETRVNSEIKCKNDVCPSTACEEISHEVYTNLNTTVDPCQDFYSFACGGWLQKYKMPPGEDSWDNYDILRSQVDMKLIEIFEEPGELHHKSPAVRTVGNFYKSCVDKSLGKEIAYAEFKRIVEKAGGWPMISLSWSPENFNWEEAFLYLDYNLGYSKGSLFKIEIQEYESSDDEDALKGKHIQLSRPDTILWKFLSVDGISIERATSRQQIFRSSIQRKVARLNPIMNTNVLEEQIDELEDFIKKLTNLSRETQVKDTEYDKIDYTLLEGMERYKHVDWYKILSQLFKNVNIKIDYNRTIIWYDDYFLTKIGELIKNTPKRAIANYFGLIIMSHLGEDTVFRKSNKEDIKHDCAKVTEKLFPLVTSYVFINRTFSPRTLTDLHEFVEQLKASFTLTIQQSDWMDNKTKLKAQLKLNKMLTYIARPPWLVGYGVLDRAYEKLGLLSPENYINNYKKVKKWSRQRELEKLESESDEETFHIPSDINAYNAQEENKLEFPAGIFHPPFYWPEGPFALNFGAIGTTMGHEITHGFDDEGSKRDEDGNLKNWWTKETRRKLKAKIKCFVNQYSNYVEPITGQKVNGTLTVGENIADSGGVHQAFIVCYEFRLYHFKITLKAYKMYSAVGNAENDLRLPLQMERFTKEQLFFISFAQQDCKHYSVDGMKDQLKDEHGPSMVRINGPLSNSVDFSRVFKCKEGSKMNPTKKCSLW